MFRWLRRRQRRRLLKQDFPDSWRSILSHNALFVASLKPVQRNRLEDAIQILVAEKNWEGCAGLTLADEHRVTIAAQMARMTLGWNEEYFEGTQSVLVYPDAYLAKSQEYMGSGVVMESQSGRLGEAWYRGPVILSWNDVLATGRRQNYARNVVVHEFAHQLDMRNGSHPDGIPVIESASQAQRWQAVLERDWQRLRHMCAQGEPGILDCYGTTNQAEFFAVASEVFFEEPMALRDQWPEFYALLEQFYLPQ